MNLGTQLPVHNRAELDELAARCREHNRFAEFATIHPEAHAVLERTAVEHAALEAAVRKFLTFVSAS